MPRHNRRMPDAAPGRTPTRRRTLLELSEGRCHYCGVKLDLTTMTADHVKPKSRGGPTRIDNLVACCKRCNTLKGDRTVDEFRATHFRSRGFWHERRQHDYAAGDD